MNDWTWDYDGYEPDQEGLRETLCAVGNGYVVTRAALPDTSADGIHYPGTYAAGVYNRRTSDVDGHAVDNEDLVNLPNWLPLTFRIDEGAWFSIDDVDVIDYRQSLDLRRAVLTRHLRFRHDQERTTTMTERRFASMRNEHACALETTIVAEDWSGTVDVRSALDGTVQNTGVERYRELESQHLAPVCTAGLDDESILLEVETNRSHVRIAMAARTRIVRNQEQLTVDRSLNEQEMWVDQTLRLDVKRGDEITVEKVVTVYTGRDDAIEEPAVSAARWLPRLDDFERLLTDHTTAWGHLWERFHVELGNGARSLPIVRLHLVHLLQTVSRNSAGLDVGVPPRGWHGEAYRGHILWDELFIFPLLNLRIPALTRSLLLYRFRRLPEARHAAREAGFSGAMYPWQSGSDGREESQQLHLNPQSGRWIPDPTHRQRHIGIAVAYNVWQYYQATEDHGFLIHHGAEMLIEIARFWSSIAEYDRTLDRFVIRGVMGPDEFHSAYPDDEREQGIDNNAYTNVMAAWVLLRAMDAIELLPAQDRQALLDTLEVRSSELDRWCQITTKMFVPFHDDGIISQFEDYVDLEELDWDGYRERYGDIHRLDRILEAEDDTVNRYKASKQADTLMLFYLLSADELTDLLDRFGYEFDRKLIPANIDYYLERTSHGSTLSAVVHAWVLARAHREDAVELFERALEADVADIQGGTTPEGIHLAAMAGSVDLLQRCFSGLETRGDCLRLNPYWPESLGFLEFRILYREHPILLRITGDRVEVSASEDGLPEPITVWCRDETAELSAGSHIIFPLHLQQSGA